MTAPNIAALTDITTKTAVLAVTTTPTDIISNAVGSNKSVKIDALMVANVNGSAAATITASIFRAAVEYKFAHVISVAAGATLVLLDRSTSIYLEEGDTIRLTASANAYLHAVCSYEVIG